MTETTGPPPDDLLDGLHDALAELADALIDLPFGLQTPQRDEAVITQRRVADQLHDHVLPRLKDIEAPLLVVVGGSTGAGKSTLVNSIVGKRVSETGVLRPTTRTPVLVHHPADTEWFASGRILPDFTRTGSQRRRANTLRQVATSNIRRGLAILDAPDFDSIDEANRDMADQLIAAADLLLFVTSAARYADQVPWDHLLRAAERQASVAMVLDRTSPGAVRAVRQHLAKMLTSRGLADVALFTVPESTPDAAGVLPAKDVAQIVMWLRELAQDGEARRQIVDATLEGAIDHVLISSRAVIAGVDEQIETAEQLLDETVATYAEAVDTVVAQATDGSLLKGKVLSTWQEFVGAGELFAATQRKVSSWRDKLLRSSSRSSSLDEVSQVVTNGLHHLILDEAEKAAATTVERWTSHPAGRDLLTQIPSPDRASRDMRVRAERLVREWTEYIERLVEQEAEGKVAKGKALSYGVNTLAVSAMVTVFVSTAGLTGAELGIAAGSALAGQKLLEALFGDQCVRSLTKKIADDFHARVADEFALEMDRFGELVPDVAALKKKRDRLARTVAQLDGEFSTDD